MSHRYHELYDYAHWRERFPVADLRNAARDFVSDKRRREPSFYSDDLRVEEHIKLMSPGGERVTDAAQIAVVEQLREESRARRDPGACVPTDVFVFWPGEAPNRAITKIGGLPYWPKERAWPQQADGQPFGFIAQISFVDSTDIAGPLPGDILLIFGLVEMFIDEFRLDDPRFYCRDWDEPGTFRFEWMTLTDADLVSSAQLGLSERLFPYWAQRHRTVDLPASVGHFDELNGSDCLEIIHGTKIGGTAPWIQWEAGLPGRFLCSLCSFHPTSGLGIMKKIYSITDERSDRVDIQFGDAGAMYISVDGDGVCHSTVQYY